MVIGLLLGRSLGGLADEPGYHAFDALVHVLDPLGLFQGEGFELLAGPWFADASPPLLAIHGDADEVNPPASSTRVYEAAHPPKLLAIVRGGTHVGAFESDASRAAVVRLVADFLRAYLLHDPAAAARIIPEATVPGILDLQASA